MSKKPSDQAKERKLVVKKRPVRKLEEREAERARGGAQESPSIRITTV